jgi:hypothetical protein
MEEIVCVLLADLHFGSDFDREAELPPIEHARLADLLGLASPINRFFRDRCQAHDLAVTGALARYLTAVFMDARANGFKGESFDLYLLLGDIVTWPSPSAFRFAGQYVTREAYGSLKGKGVPHCAGLKAPRDRIVTIPGNHDKLLEPNLNAFHAGFLAPIGLDLDPRPGASYFISKALKGVEFLFILVEASVYGTLPMEMNWHVRNHLASGHISDSLVQEVLRKSEDLRHGVRVDGAELADYDKAVKILVLHYAADDAAVLQGFGGLDAWFVPHACEGVETLVGALKGDLRLIVHGHLHQARRYRVLGVSAVSVPSATQRGAANGFYLLRVSGDDFRVEHHVWRRTAFVVDPSEFSGPV